MKVITIGNFKGGTGKTTNSCMIAYTLSNMGYKTLLVDLDPQANATALFLQTRQSQKDEVKAYDSTLMKAITDNNLKEIITDIKENLYLIPSFADFSSYPLFLEKKFPNSQKDRIFFMKSLLDNIKDDYDYLILDTPPTLSIFTDSAVVASDAVVIVTQTQERSFIGAQAFVGYLQELYDLYDINFDVAGVLPVLLKNTAPVDKRILASIKDEFGEDNVFKNVVKNMERLKRYDITGIVDPNINEDFDMHDKKVHKLYTDLANEFVEKVNRVGE
ncbi:ParA family protein [Peptostreptococcus faecalis]|uniref:ParA family protein n=1 Tax=Peptostreptococcus faecalis TaxID=2045015 RepID=UPI000C7B8727|nr:AAA family ATPase [Peptostreptococcus faecalis]